MTKILNWFSGGDYVPSGHQDALWTWVTLGLSALLAIGYVIIAINWYFQAKLSRRTESRAALRRLFNICLACAICGFVFFVTDTPWRVWRMYDLALLIFVCHTWHFVFRMRGLSLVDERLAQVDELERSATKYREIAELLPHVVWTATGTGAVDFSNQRWHEYGNDSESWIEAIHSDEREQCLAKWNHSVATRSPLNVEVRLAGRSGYRTFVVKATPIVHGDAVKWLGACADIEDQKLLVAEKEKQAKQKAFFLNALSHDLRAPLHNVLLNAQLLKMSASEQLEVESLTMIVENAIAAGDLVSKLLDFARVGAQENNEMQVIPIAGMLHQIARRFIPIAEQKGLYLKINADFDLHARTDRQKLERIISNLVDNAIKYTRHGGVTVELLALNADAIVRICDTGIGVPPAHIPYLFDEFYQVDNYERDRSKGFGMGLAICRYLARHIGADVRLADTGPGGSCFEIVLKGHDPHSGRRSGSAPGDHANPSEAGLCRV
ncbi:MAG TPA: PAS domain-containing sensor histidine kinase [Tepidisphaeraceae bacterium]|jgi:signal transduction histidine kinase|nr:PAS domain-containing sensor histidine kinase [Tepidisphaeraceae bacterium]